MPDPEIAASVSNLLKFVESQSTGDAVSPRLELVLSSPAFISRAASIFDLRNDTAASWPAAVDLAAVRNLDGSLNSEERRWAQTDVATLLHVSSQYATVSGALEARYVGGTRQVLPGCSI
jgi:hypothetical protein